jgi:exodeoxyribonuclease V alpha subunit
MQTKNDYEIQWEKGDEVGEGIFNGDIGIIKQIDKNGEFAVIRFDDEREAAYFKDQLLEVELAYAITIHKSQGSEYPAVILPLLSGPPILMNRNLLYTAVTRAKSCVVIVGNGYMIETMIKNNNEQKRYSSLDLRLKEFGEKL